MCREREKEREIATTFERHVFIRGLSRSGGGGGITSRRLITDSKIGKILQDRGWRALRTIALSIRSFHPRQLSVNHRINSKSVRENNNYGLDPLSMLTV